MVLESNSCNRSTKRYKLTVVGDEQCGKTSLLNALVKNDLDVSKHLLALLYHIVDFKINFHSHKKHVFSFKRHIRASGAMYLIDSGPFSKRKILAGARYSLLLGHAGTHALTSRSGVGFFQASLNLQPLQLFD